MIVFGLDGAFVATENFLTGIRMGFQYAAILELSNFSQIIPEIIFQIQPRPILYFNVARTVT